MRTLGEERRKGPLRRQQIQMIASQVVLIAALYFEASAESDDQGRVLS
jgi:hypothetical protein